MDVAGECSSYDDKEYRKGETMPINSARRKAKKESPPKKRRAVSYKRQGKHNEESDYQQHIHEKKLAEGSRSKKGCAPKLFMLLLPLMAVGAYLILRS
jgi:hypothetical protein